MTITPIGLESQTNLVRRNSQDHTMACLVWGPLSETTRRQPWADAHEHLDLG
jgi:hypothetical protein